MPHLLQEVHHRFGLRDVEDGPHHARDGGIVAAVRKLDEQVLGVDRADNVVAIFADHRQPGEPALPDRRHRVADGRGSRHGGDGRAVHHHLAHHPVRQAEDAPDQRLLLAFDGTCAAGLADQHHQLVALVGDVPPVGRPQPKDAQRSIGHGVEQPDEWFKHTGEGCGRRHRDQGGGLGAPQGNAFGHQFTEDDVQAGDQAKRQRRGKGLVRCRLPAGGNPGEQRPYQRGDKRLPDPPQAKAGHRDAQLRGGDKRLGILRGPLDQPRPAASLAHQLGNPGAAGLDDGELCRHEQPVGRDQREHHQQAERDRCGREIHARHLMSEVPRCGERLLASSLTVRKRRRYNLDDDSRPRHAARRSRQACQL